MPEVFGRIRTGRRNTNKIRWLPRGCRRKVADIINRRVGRECVADNFVRVAGNGERDAIIPVKGYDAAEMVYGRRDHFLASLRVGFDQAWTERRRRLPRNSSQCRDTWVVGLIQCDEDQRRDHKLHPIRKHLIRGQRRLTVNHQRAVSGLERANGDGRCKRLGWKRSFRDEQSNATIRRCDCVKNYSFGCKPPGSLTSNSEYCLVYIYRHRLEAFISPSIRL